MNNRKRLLLFGFIPLIVGIIVIFGYSFLNMNFQPDVCNTAPPAPTDIEILYIPTLLEIGEQAPEISLPDVYGNNFSLSSLRGKVVLLNFMGTWCAACVWEMGDFIDLYNLHSREELTFLSVAIESNGKVQDVIDFKSEYCADWTFILDDGDISSSFKVELLPTTFVIDKFGNIMYSQVGLINSTQLSRVFDDIIRS